MTNAVIQSLNLTHLTPQLIGCSLENTLFLDCIIEPYALELIWSKGALVFPSLGDFPYSPYQGSLYHPDELLVEGYEHGNPESLENTLDIRVYKHYLKTGKTNPYSLIEALARRLHDHFSCNRGLHSRQTSTGFINGGACGGTEVSIKPYQIIATLQANNNGNLNKTFFVPSTSAKKAFIQPLDVSNCMVGVRKKLTLIND